MSRRSPPPWLMDETRDEPPRIALNIAKLPELLRSLNRGNTVSRNNEVQMRKAGAPRRMRLHIVDHGR